MNKQSVVTLILLSIAMFLVLIFGVMLLFSFVDLTNGCLYRYTVDKNGAVSSSDALLKTITLNANASDASINGTQSYGKWINTGVQVSPNQRVKYEIRGEISLCKSYLPLNNLQSDSNKDNNGNGVPIAIPRATTDGANFTNIYFDAKTDKWRNALEVFKGDHIIVSLLKDQQSQNTKTENSINGMIDANCAENQQSYHPTCGKYSIWDSTSPYVSSCNWNAQCKKCNEVTSCERNGNCKKWDWRNGVYVCVKRKKTCETTYDWCGCYEDRTKTAPEAYKNDGTYTSEWHDDIDILKTNFDRDCSTETEYINGDYQNEKYFWFSADNAAALLYRFDDSESPTDATKQGSDYHFAQIAESQSFYEDSQDSQIILNTVYDEKDIGYLQYRFLDNSESFSHNTGGYSFKLQHTKCVRSNGATANDTFVGRGAVQYVIPSDDLDPNITAPTSVKTMLVDKDGDGEFYAEQTTDGYLWLKILNNESDYKDSDGAYNIQFYTYIPRKDFFTTVLDPLFSGLKTRIKAASVTMFKNMVCYKSSDTSNCTDFFQYIKFVLIIYVMFYGMMFLMGMVKINQTDIVIRVIKVGLVAGLINGDTFEFFNMYVLDLVTGFSDDIMSNMSGYSIISGNEKLSNPFMFLNEVMTKIFLSTTFYAQVLALFAMGLNGVIYFVLIFISIGIVVIVSFRAISIYLMALVGISVLIGLAPLFLTFILFERTKHLFDAWVRFMVTYMLEPVVMLAGIIILTQLFTIYLDYLLSYSVCWKCALPFSLPFPEIDGVTPLFLNVPLFCLNWFAPWGADYRNIAMGVNMQHIIVIVMLAYCMWGYLDFSGRIVAQITGGAGAASATATGSSMSHNIQERTLSSLGTSSQQLFQGAQNNAKAAAYGAGRGIARGTIAAGKMTYNAAADSSVGRGASATYTATGNAYDQTKKAANAAGNKAYDKTKKAASSAGNKAYKKAGSAASSAYKSLTTSNKSNKGAPIGTKTDNNNAPKDPPKGPTKKN